MDHPVASLDRLAAVVNARHAGHRRPVAKAGIPAVLAMEEPSPLAWAAPHSEIRSPPDLSNVECQSSLGRASDSWRTLEARDRRESGHRIQVYEETAQTSLTNLAYLSQKPLRGH